MKILIPTYTDGFPSLEDSPWREFEEKMRENTTIDPKTGCWLYNGHKTNSGHCQIMVNRVQQYVHRISAAIYLGYDLFDTEHQVNHRDDLCSAPSCWNYIHLYIGTKADNVSDYMIKGTHNQVIKTHCPQEHEYTPENTHITKSGKRMCRTCHRERERERRKRLYGR